MDILWAPWRGQYLNTYSFDNDSDCFICDAVQDSENDEARLIIYRSELSIVLLNKYPYNGGHILIAPKSHISDFENLSIEQLNDIMFLSQIAIKCLKKIKHPDAFNIGMNIGRSAGAGLPGHIHQHIIPRWNGDTGFISTICDTKVISESLEQIQKLIKMEFIHTIQENKNVTK